MRRYITSFFKNGSEVARQMAVFFTLSFIFATATVAQPYYYYPKYVDDHWNANIYRINFQAGVTEQLIPDTLNITDLDWDPSQTHLFLLTRSGGIEVINAANPANRDTILKNERTEEVHGLLFAPQVGKFYVSWSPQFGSDTIKTASFSANTYQKVSTLSDEIIVDHSAFSSPDGLFIYTEKSDTTSDSLYIETVSTMSDSIVRKKSLDEIGPKTSCKLMETGSHGKGLIGYNYPSCEHVDNHYVLYDPTTDSVIQPISFPWRSKAYLSADAKYVIIEEVLFEKSPTEPQEYPTGNIYVFESATGKLAQHLNLPPEGMAFVFDGYPNNFYYYIPGTQQSLTVDLTLTTPISILLDSLVSMKHQAQSNGWLGDQNFVNELDSNLAAAKSYLLQSDSNNTARQLRIFRQKIDEEYKDSLDGDNKSVNVEGWKLLYFNAGYVLARLPVPLTQFSLTLNTVGSGTVTKSPNQSLYDTATTVQLTAAPSPGYSFSGWTGDASGPTNPLSVTMNANKSITATFTQSSFTITSSAGPNGSITPLGNNSVNAGDSITFTITPATGYRISSVFIDNADTSVGTVSSYMFRNVTGNHLISGFFAINQYIITASCGPHGSIDPLGDNTVNYGDSLTFTITPGTGYLVSDVFIDSATSVGAVTSYTFRNVTANHTVDAFFAINQYSLTANSNPTGGGTVTKSPDQPQYDGNTVVQLTAAPNTGYHFVSWSGDASGSTNPTSLTINGNKNVTANFAINTYALTVTAVNGSVTKNPNQAQYDSNTVVQLTAAPNTGYHFVNWSGDASGSANPTSVTMNANKNVTANFAINTYTLTVTAVNGSVIKNPNQAQYDSNTVVQLTAVPNTGYHLVSWSGDASGSANPTSVTMNANKNVTANFAINTYTLTVTAVNGSVIKNPNQAQYDSNTVVQLTAVPNTGYRFDDWSGDASGPANPTSVTMNSAKTVTANFTRQFQLTVSSSPDTNAGTTIPRGSNWYDSSTVVSVTATAKTGYRFDHWSGGASGSANPTSVAMNSAKTVTANFTRQFQLTVSSSPDTNKGTTWPRGSSWYDSSTVASITATPKSCYHFVNWSGDAGGSGNPLNVTMNANKNITANFAVNVDTILASVNNDFGANGTISPSGAVSVNCGGNQTFAMTPNAHYHVASVAVDDTNRGALPTYTFTNVTANHTIEASFGIDQYDILATGKAGGSISPSGHVIVDYWSNRTFTISPSNCYYIDSVIVDGTNQGAISSYTFTHVTANHTIRASFRTNQYTITASAGGGGSISPSGNVAVNCGANQTFTITPNSGNSINNVTVDGVSRGAISSYTFTNVTSNHSIAATFNTPPCLPPCCIDAASKVDQLTLTDAQGNQKTLLVRNADRPYAPGVNDTALVSQLAAGTLNAGFQSGQLVQTVSPGQANASITIWVQGATYPVKLKFTPNSTNKVQYLLVGSGQQNTALTNTSSLVIGSAGTITLQALANKPCP